MKKYISDLFVISVLVLTLFITSLGINYLPYKLLFSVRILIVAAIFVSTFSCLKHLFYDESIKKNIKGYAISFAVLLFVLLVFESIFMLIPRSHGVGYTYGTRIWRIKHAQSTNSLGFRDHEPTYAKPLILFVGDSFTYGHGIKNTDNRFSNIVGNKQDMYNTANIGAPGSDSRQEYKALLKFVNNMKVKPDKIVLQYYGNDIEMVAIKNGLSFRGFEPYSGLNLLEKGLIQGSFIINYIYWLYPHTDTKPYLDFLETAYKDSSILKKHTEDLHSFIEYAENNSIELIVVVFPFLQDIALSEELYTRKIVKFFSEEKVKTINVAKLLRNYETKELVVNNNDGHPSVLVNEIVAHEIINIIKQN